MEMELKLTILERVTIPMMMPAQYDLADGMVKGDIKKKLDLTKEEKHKINYKDLPRGISAWGSFLKCQKCGTVFKDPYIDEERAKFKCDDCGGKEYGKFEQHTEMSKIFKFAKAEIFFLDKQVTRLNDEKKIEDRFLDLCLKIRELMKEIPTGLQEVKKTTARKKP